MLVVGGIFSAGGVYLTARDFLFLFPGWLWLTVGVAIFLISLTGMLYQFQRRLDLVTVAGKGQISNFPKRPHYTKTQIQEARECLDKFIQTGEELKTHIEPQSLDNITEIRNSIAKFDNDTSNEVGKLMPEYSEYFASLPTGLDVLRYNSWYIETAEEAKKIDRLLLKLRKMRQQI